MFSIATMQVLYFISIRTLNLFWIFGNVAAVWRCKKAQVILNKIRKFGFKNNKNVLEVRIDAEEISHLFYAFNVFVGEYSRKTWFSWTCVKFCRYAWSVLTCSGCRFHLGWKFTAQQPHLVPKEFWGIRNSSIDIKYHKNTEQPPRQRIRLRHLPRPLISLWRKECFSL